MSNSKMKIERMSPNFVWPPATKGEWKTILQFGEREWNIVDDRVSFLTQISQSQDSGRVTHVKWVILYVSFNGNCNFNIWPEGQVKNGKKSIFEIIFLIDKHIFSD